MLHPIEDKALIQMALRSASVDEIAAELARRAEEMSRSVGVCKVEARNSDDLVVVMRAADLARSTALLVDQLTGAVVQLLPLDHALVKQVCRSCSHARGDAELAGLRLRYLQKVREVIDG